VKQSTSCLGLPVFLLSFLFCLICGLASLPAISQSVPYAREYPKSKEEVEKALKELGAYTGQKLPIVDGFVATGDRPLDLYERAFYQFSINVVPQSTGHTVVRLTAKITAWYADREPWKASYQTLPSNGRLELDFLDRLGEKFGEKPVTSVLKSQVQAPAAKLDLTTGIPKSRLPPPKGSGTTPAADPAAASATAAATDELVSLRVKREAEERRMRQLADELRNLQDIERNQAHPANLVVVKKNGTPILSKAADGSPVLFSAAADDEFEFLDVNGGWVHVQISGASRGYIRRDSLELPQLVAERFNSPNPAPETAPEPFQLESEESSIFPGDWPPLRGKLVKIFTVQPTSQDPKGTTAKAKLLYATSLLKDFPAKPLPMPAAIEGIVIIFDSADGGMIGCALGDVQQFSAGTLSNAELWKRSYVEPPEIFGLSTKASP
jgi:hypothetical protein